MLIRTSSLIMHNICFLLLVIQGKQRLLYSLLDAMQSVSSQAVVIGISCRLVSYLNTASIPLWNLRSKKYWELASSKFITLVYCMIKLCVAYDFDKIKLLTISIAIQDADQLLEKRVRSRFSHRKLLFLPPCKEDVER